MNIDTVSAYQWDDAAPTSPTLHYVIHVTKSTVYSLHPRYMEREDQDDILVLFIKKYYTIEYE